MDRFVDVRGFGFGPLTGEAGDARAGGQRRGGSFVAGRQLSSPVTAPG
ncbi:hypothetical protein ACX80S_02570 [Arthrobacter sp. RHLT1-20]